MSTFSSTTNSAAGTAHASPSPPVHNEAADTFLPNDVGADDIIKHMA